MDNWGWVETYLNAYGCDQLRRMNPEQGQKMLLLPAVAVKAGFSVTVWHQIFIITSNFQADFWKVLLVTG